ncbi:MAG: glycosyltransferase family 2 protein, partial [Bacteroidetes bacterium]|nr:glycosyltransferase family 2 protein [Bacteroidota bacterium]
MRLSPVTIIIPIRNEAAYIDRCLFAILAQDYPGQIEIIIVDGMSTDDTRQKIQQLTIQPSTFNLQLLDNPAKIVPISMNIALRQAKGEIIIRVDGHCLIAPDYVSNCVRHIQSDGVDGVGGPMQTIGETPLASVIALAMSSPFGVGNSAFRTLSGANMLADTVPFPAYTRAIIQRAGLYDEEL